MNDAPAPSMPPLSKARINGIDLAFYDTGGEVGPPVIFCHGFPELAYSWRHQLRAFSAVGRRAIAPDQRGYGLSGRPAEVTDYDIVHLTDDLVGLLDTLGLEKAVFCGHDWGGIIVWQMALLRPDRVAGVIGLNTPFMARSPADPIEIFRRRLGEDMYIVHFQKPAEADAVLDANVRKAMDFFMRRPAGPVESAGFATERKPGDESAFPLVKALQMYDPSVDPRPTFLNAEEFETFVKTFERTGFTGGINWYRNFTRNWRLTEGVEEKVRAPSLMVMAELDAVLPPSSADGMEAYVPDLEKALIRGSGHWTQQEKPEDVNRVLLDWLDRRFPR